MRPSNYNFHYLTEQQAESLYQAAWGYYHKNKGKDRMADKTLKTALDIFREAEAIIFETEED